MYSLTFKDWFWRQIRRTVFKIVFKHPSLWIKLNNKCKTRRNISGPSTRKLGWLKCSVFLHLLVWIPEVPSDSPKVMTLVFGSSPLLFMSSTSFWWSPVSQDQIMLKWPYNLSSTSGHFLFLGPHRPMRKLRSHMNKPFSLSWWWCQDVRGASLMHHLLSHID